MQAALLSLFDPDRLRKPMMERNALEWAQVDKAVAGRLREARSVALVTRGMLGPSERMMIQKLKALHGGVQHFVYEPAGDWERRRTMAAIYGGDGELIHRYDRAKVILSVHSDFLGNDGATLEAIRQFAAGRRPTVQNPVMSRLYVIESALSVTGANADHRLALAPSAIDGFLEDLRKRLAARSVGKTDDFASLLISDLLASPREAVIIGGADLSPRAHAIIADLNDSLGAYGKTIFWNPSPASLAPNALPEIAAALGRGVDLLVMLGVNPMYDWPGGRFENLMKKSRFVVGHGYNFNETLAACDMALPSSHTLESWNDAAPRPGLLSVCQPVIAPLFGARQEAESLLMWMKGAYPQDAELASTKDWHEVVYGRWQRDVFPASGVTGDFDLFWQSVLRQGQFVQNTALAIPKHGDLGSLLRQTVGPAKRDGNELHLVKRTDYGVADGRFSNNPYLLEFPNSITKMVWENVASVAPLTAKQLGLQDGDFVRLKAGANSVDIACLIQPGMAEKTVSVCYGFGRTRAGRFGNKVGANVYPLDGAVVILEKLSKSERLIPVQIQNSEHDRPLVLEANLDEYRRDPKFVLTRRHLPEPVQITRPFDYSKRNRWAMVVDLSACVGCGNCVVACHAENNVATVGKRECNRGHRMHWLRIDRYYEGDSANLRTKFQVMPCQHCENAPCENVCPVAATTHSPDGINEMTYNRCVGTRYCSNNCPYKVRRFNFFSYSDEFSGDTEMRLAYNPQVTVRGRGIMEKCTFCIQRIRAAEFKSKDTGDPIADGAVVTACAQACPAGAIVFGNLADPKSRVSQLVKSDRGYRLLEELNTQPRVTYLAKVWNRKV